MRPLSITLRGIGPHTDTTIDFARFDGGVVAVYGPTGTGKTTAISALVSALFGAAPLKGDLLATIKETLSIGRSEPSSIDYTFSLPGRGTRRVSRTISKSAHKAEYFSLKPAGDELLAGPKVTDVERAIALEVGDLDTFLATAYCSRESAHDMICCKPSRRREAFGRFLNFAEYDDYSAKMKEATKALDAQAAILEAQVKGSPDWTAIKGEKHKELTIAINERDQASAHIDDLNRELEAARSSLRDAQGGEDVLRAQVAAFEAALDEVSRISREVEAIKDELDALTRRAEGLAAAEAATERLKGLRDSRESLTRQRDAHARRLRWEQRRSNVKAELDRIDARLGALRTAPGVDAATIALAGELHTIAQQYRTAEAKNVETSRRNEAFRKTLAQNQGRRASLLDQVKALEARLAKRPNGLFGESCSPCQFLAEWAAIPGQIEALKSEASTLGLAIEAAERQGEEPLIDLRPIAEQGAQAKAAKAAVDAAEKTRAEIGQAQQERERLAEVYQVLLLEEELEVGDPTIELDRVQRELDEQQRIASGLEAARHAQADLERRTATLAERQAQRADAGQRLKEATPAATSAAQALKDREAQQAALKAKEADVLARLRAAHATVSAAASKVGRIEAEITTAGRQAEEVAARAAQALEMRERIEELQWLAKCFGKTGIQPAIIDQYLPQLDELIDDVLAEMTNGRMRMRWITQKATSKGDITEGFSIVVRDEKGERDVSVCSGGETQILQAANRIGLALWLSQLRGVPCETLIFDEAANNIDDNCTEAFVRAIQRISHRFALIVLITPKAEMARLVPQRIELEPKLRSVSVNYIGATAPAAESAA